MSKSYFVTGTGTDITIPETVTWNGAMNNGETAPDGSYTYYVTATDDNGNVYDAKSWCFYIRNDSDFSYFDTIQQVLFAS